MTQLQKKVEFCHTHNFLGGQILYNILIGFHLDFDLNNRLKHELKNHSSAKVHPNDINLFVFYIASARVILRRVVYRWRKPVHTAL